MAFASGVLFVNPTPIPFWDVPLDGSPSSAFGDLYQKNPWDTLFLGGVQMPGVCLVKAMPTIRFDEKKPPGVDGLTITAQGYIPGPVDIEITIWTSEQWAKYQEVRGKIWTTPRRGGKIKALDIRHPGSDDAKIRSIVIKGWSIPEPGPIVGTKVIKIKAVEFLPPNTKNRAKTIDKTDAEDDPRTAPAKSKNAGSKSPGETDTGPTGAAKEKKPGST